MVFPVGGRSTPEHSRTSTNTHPDQLIFEPFFVWGAHNSFSATAIHHQVPNNLITITVEMSWLELSWIYSYYRRHLRMASTVPKCCFTYRAAPAHGLHYNKRVPALACDIHKKKTTTKQDDTTQLIVFYCISVPSRTLEAIMKTCLKALRNLVFDSIFVPSMTLEAKRKDCHQQQTILIYSIFVPSNET